MKKGFLALVLGVLFVSSEGFALIHGQALIGQRKLNLKNDDSSTSHTGQELKLAVHLDPIPLIPIAFGAYLSTTSFDKDLDGSEYGLELTAWLPLLVIDIKPYAKLAYTIHGSYTKKVGGGIPAEVEFTPSGLRMAAGIKWGLLPFTALLLEVEQTNITLKHDKFKLSGDLGEVTLAGDDVKTDSFGILLGVEVGI